MGAPQEDTIDDIKAKLAAAGSEVLADIKRVEELNRVIDVANENKKEK